MADAAVMRLRLRVRSALDHYRAGGWRIIGNLLSINGYLPRWLWYLEDVDLLCLEPAGAGLRLPPSELEFRFAGEADLPALAVVAQANGSRLPVTELEAEIRALHDAGQRCAIALHQGEIVGYNWLFSRECPIGRPGHEITLALAPGQRFLSRAYVRPAYRLRGVYPGIVQHVLESCGADIRLYTVAPLIAPAVLRANLRLGFRTVLRLSARRLLGRRSWSYRSPHGVAGSIDGPAPRLELAAFR